MVMHKPALAYIIICTVFLGSVDFACTPKVVPLSPLLNTKMYAALLKPWLPSRVPFYSPLIAELFVLSTPKAKCPRFVSRLFISSVIIFNIFLTLFYMSSKANCFSYLLFILTSYKAILLNIKTEIY